MNLNEELRIKIMRLREKKGLSQTEFADLLGISRSHMNKLENGTIHISLIYLKQMSEVLGVTIDELVNKKEIEAKEMLPFDFKGVNTEILELHKDPEDFGLVMNPEDLLVTEEKLENWKDQAESGAIIVGSVGCRYLIITTETIPVLKKPGFIIPKFGFVNIDHANWELCRPVFESAEDLIEWFAGVAENPVIDVIPARSVEKNLPGGEYV